MKIKLLIATADKDYADHLSNVLSEKHSDTFEVNVCSSAERLKESLISNKYDTVLLEPGFAAEIDLNSAPLPLILWDGSGGAFDNIENYKKVPKYQRVSAIAATVLESYADISAGESDYGTGKTQITAVWSPCGGTGKTTVSLAYAAHSITCGKQAVYLNLENFSSTAVYFPQNGKSISTVFEKLDSNVHMLLLSLRQRDNDSGIHYFCEPENYDDINILTGNDVETLVRACAKEIDELVIDLPSQCDERVEKVFELADVVFVVCDSSVTSQIKLRQFINQHDISHRIYKKIVLINNKGAVETETGIDKTIWLPLIQSADPISVYKMLSGSSLK